MNIKYKEKSNKPKWPRPVQRPNFGVTHLQLDLLTGAMPEKYQGLVRMAVEQRKPLSQCALSKRDRMLAIRAFKKAQQIAGLPEMVFHDLTRVNVR